MTPPATLSEDQRARLKLASRHLPGPGPRHPAAEFEAITAWLRAEAADPARPDSVQGLEADVYGAGPLIEDFERHVAALFGKEAGRFMPSGCMAQPIALRIWSDLAGNPATAFHPTSHLELHEEGGYRELHGLTAHLLGESDRPTTAADLSALIGPGGDAPDSGIASLLLELPAREIGGQLPSWEELLAIRELTQRHGIRLHLDGARIWQAAPAYDRSLAEIGSLFDSIYVSFYKDVGALPGAMLLGPKDFIAEAAIWQRRQGGTLFTAMGNVVSARLHLAECLEAMPRLLERAQAIAPLFSAYDRATVVPDPPHTNMFHLRFAAEADAVLAARDETARRAGIWLFNAVKPVAGQGAVRTEISLGSSSLALADDDLAEAIALFFALLEDPQGGADEGPQP